MENKIKHLEMIQGVINRMASNSFMLKGWAVTILSGMFALAGNKAQESYYLIAYLPIVAFWWLDSFYLHQERLYRLLYDKVRKMNTKDIDFSMRATSDGEEDPKFTLRNCFLSKTEKYFYGSLILVCTGIIVFIYHFEEVNNIFAFLIYAVNYIIKGVGLCSQNFN